MPSDEAVEILETCKRVAAILQDVWFARQIAWLGGRIGAADVWRDIHTAITLVLAD